MNSPMRDIFPTPIQSSNGELFSSNYRITDVRIKFLIEIIGVMASRLTLGAGT
jgi:hypothetical protein